MSPFAEFVLPARSRAARILIGVLCAAVATGARVLLDPLTGSGAVPWAPYFLGVLVAALLGGGIGAVVAIATSALVGDYLFVVPQGEFSVLTGTHVGTVAVFVLVAGCIASVGIHLRRSLFREREGHERLAAAEARAQAALKELAAIYEQAPVGLCAIDRELRYIKVNERLAAMNGLAPEAHVGRSVREVVPDLAETAERIIGTIVRTGQPVRNLEFTGESPTMPGVQGVWNEHWFPLFHDGVLIGANVVVEDITESKRAERAVRESEQRWRLLANVGDLNRSLTDPREIIPATLQALRDHLRADRCVWVEIEEDETHFSFVADACAPGVASIHGRFAVTAFGPDALHALRAGRAFVCADALRDLPEGTELGAFRQTGIRALIATPMFRGGRLLAATGVHMLSPRQWTPGEIELVREVTERCSESIGRARMEEALRASEAFYRQTLESMPGMAFTNTADGTCEYVGAQWVAFTGVPAERLLGTGWSQVVHPDDRDRAWRAWRAAVERGVPYDIEYRVCRPNGAHTWVKITASPIRDGAGRIVRWLGTGMPIDDIKETEEALRRSDRRKDEFLAMLAHELRNPLAPIRNAVEVLSSIGPSEPRLEASRAIIRRQVAHMTRLVDDLLDVSRITRGKITLDPHPVAIDELVDAAVEAARPELEQHEQTISVQVPDGLVVNADRARLVQVLTNLLTNAAKFSPPGGHVTVWSKRAPDGVVVSVRDTGIGIPRDAQARIFDLFAQEDASLDRSRGGLGVGLTLVKRLVELHGGWVRVSSDGPGKGAEFSIGLPLAATAHPPSEVAAPAPRPGGQLRILIIEDNPDAAASFRMLLEIDGHEVHVAYDGRQGLRAIDALAPDVAFVDLGLPGIDGFSLARSVRERRTGPPMLVALSGYGRAEDKRRALEAGFDEHLTKPADLEVVRALLARRAGAVVLGERTGALH